jgi:hypothetical protein
MDGENRTDMTTDQAIGLVHCRLETDDWKVFANEWKSYYNLRQTAEKLIERSDGAQSRGCTKNFSRTTT